MSLLQVNQDPDIYSIKLPLPGNPLKDLNVYVITTGEGQERRALFIDCGFRMPECENALLEGINELGIPFERSSLFLTHLHSDHTGLAELFTQRGCKAYMGEKDVSILKATIDRSSKDKYRDVYLKNGFPESILDHVMNNNPIYKLSAKTAFPVIPVHDGDILDFPGEKIQCIHTPGHTPGHVCLYLERAGMLFAGDHILYGITPNICRWYGTEDSLGDYIESLMKVDALPFDTAFAAHRQQHPDPHKRIKELLKHHEVRLFEVMRILKENPGSDAYSIAGRMTWSIRAKDWEDFPPVQKWFAVGEALAHLDHLEKTGRVISNYDEKLQQVVYSLPS